MNEPDGGRTYTRREVLQTSLLAGAGLALAPTLLACGGDSSDSASFGEPIGQRRAEEGGQSARRHRRRVRQRDPRRADRRRDRPERGSHALHVRLAAHVEQRLRAREPHGRRGDRQRRRVGVDRAHQGRRRVPQRQDGHRRRHHLELQAHHRSQGPQDGLREPRAAQAERPPQDRRPDGRVHADRTQRGVRRGARLLHQLHHAPGLERRRPDRHRAFQAHRVQARRGVQVRPQRELLRSDPLGRRARHHGVRRHHRPCQRASRRHRGRDLRPAERADQGRRGRRHEGAGRQDRRVAADLHEPDRPSPSPTYASGRPSSSSPTDRP